MSVSPEVAQLLLNLADVTLRNTAGAVTTRISAVRRGKQHDEVVNGVMRATFERLSDSERAAFADMLTGLVEDAPGAGV